MGDKSVMNSKSGELSHAEKMALYEKLIATQPKIECKGAANSYTSVNGHMFSLCWRRVTSRGGCLGPWDFHATAEKAMPSRTWRGLEY